MIFWDPSALVKCYAALEPGHARAKNLLLREKEQLGSTLLRPEAASAIVRRIGGDRRLADSLLTLLDDHLKHFHLLPMDEDQVALSVRLVRKYSLRAADALHLAAALTFARELGRRSLWVATADAEQASAAKREGLKVIAPGA